MKKSTYQIIKTALSFDDTVTIEQQRQGLSILSNRPLNDPLKPLLLNQSQTAQLLGVSRVSIYRMAKVGQLHPVNILGCKRFRRDEVEEVAMGK
ncbi:MAG: helix-turn-helix domain-containing protein [Kiritimatiellae bacterium]|nr:helix-turn-helix domain-containing protein [Kiritimatiellia bacterium]MDD5519446.1 helix-turn-helix domain-containing protein [Kiritimatiellia bacterium]